MQPPGSNTQTSRLTRRALLGAVTGGVVATAGCAALVPGECYEEAVVRTNLATDRYRVQFASSDSNPESNPEVSFDEAARTVTIVGVVGGAGVDDENEAVAVERLVLADGELDVRVVTQQCGRVGDGEFEVVGYELVVSFPEGEALPDSVRATEVTGRGRDRVVVDRPG